MKWNKNWHTEIEMAGPSRKVLKKLVRTGEESTVELRSSENQNPSSVVVLEQKKSFQMSLKISAVKENLKLIWTGCIL